MKDFGQCSRCSRRAKQRWRFLLFLPGWVEAVSRRPRLPSVSVHFCSFRCLRKTYEELTNG